MSELNNFTRLFKNVKRCKELNWQEKALLSEIISYQLDGKLFKIKDKTLAVELGMDKGSVSKFINRLSKKGVVDKTTKSFASLSGGKPKRQRTVTVIDIEKWTKGYTAPVVEPLTSTKTNQKKANTIKNITNEAEVKPIDILPSINDLRTLDFETDIKNDMSTGEVFIRQIKEGKVFKFEKVNVKLIGGEVILDEATKVPHSGKYFLKSTLIQMEPSISV